MIFPDFDGRAQDNIIYFDNVYGSNSNTGINKSPKLDLLLYPNPAKNKVTIDTPNYKGTIAIDVFDLLRNLVNTTQSRAISLKGFSKGIYVFKIAFDGNTELIKVIKE